jgi:hypothetical protein
MLTLRLSSRLLALSLLASCLGTETGNPPLIHWRGTPCKPAGTRTKAVTLQSLDSSLARLDTDGAYDNPLYEGLNCIVWQRVDETTLRIDVTNYEDACGSDSSWTPSARLDDSGTLQLLLEDTKCQRAGCDSDCMFDFSYTVRVADSTQDLPVRLTHEGCGYEPNSRSAVLPLSTRAQGAVCRHADFHVHAGTLRTPCQRRGIAVACESRLVCAEAGASEPLCLPPCSSDADCDPLTQCQEAVCKLRATGLQKD